jgi:hypothetical protein
MKVRLLSEDEQREVEYQFNNWLEEDKYIETLSTSLAFGAGKYVYSMLANKQTGEKDFHPRVRMA